MSVNGTNETETPDDADRWAAVAKQFAAVNLRLSNQGVAIDGLSSQAASTNDFVKKISEDTGAMLAAWHDGVETRKLFCRMATAWKFMFRDVFLPFVIPLAIIYMTLSYAMHGAFPDWAKAFFRVFF